MMNGGANQYHQRMHQTLPNHAQRPDTGLPPNFTNSQPNRNSTVSPAPSTMTTLTNVLTATTPLGNKTSITTSNQQSSVPTTGAVNLASKSTKLMNSSTASRSFIATQASTNSTTDFHLNHHHAASLKKQQIHQMNNNRMHDNNHTPRNNHYHSSLIHETTNANINRVLKSHPHVKAELLEKISHLTSEKDISDYIKFYFDRFGEFLNFQFRKQKQKKALKIEKNLHIPLLDLISRNKSRIESIEVPIDRAHSGEQSVDLWQIAINFWGCS